MMRSTPAALAASLLTLYASSARADPVQHIGPRFFGGTADLRRACQLLATTRPSRSTAARPPIAPSPAPIVECLQLLRAALSTPDTATLDEVPGLPTEGARHRALLNTYRAIQQLTPWVQRSAERSLAFELASLETDTIAALSAHALVGARYAAVLHGGFVEADPGGYDGQPPGTSSRGTTSAEVLVVIETEHVGVGAGWDASLGFQFGRQPVLTMARAAAEAAATPAYKNGWFIASDPVRIALASASAETAIVGRVGATRLDADPTLAANDVAEWALFFDARVDFRWYARDVWLAHLASETLDPLVQAYVGVRHDQRFHRAGDLEPFNDPTGRGFFGFRVSPIRVADRRAESSGAALFTVGGGFEFEGALRGPARLPSGFRLVLGGRLDLLRALHGGHFSPASEAR